MVMVLAVFYYQGLVVVVLVISWALNREKNRHDNLMFLNGLFISVIVTIMGY